MNLDSSHGPQSHATYADLAPLDHQLEVSSLDLYAKKIDKVSITWGKILSTLENPSVVRARREDCRLLKLATFGEQRTERGSLRFDENLLKVYGVEGDYDCEIMTLDKAHALLQAAGIEAFLYTTPSNGVDNPPHSRGGPRWRVLAPLSRSYEPHERARFVAKLNTVLQGALSAESFTASQTFYVGKVAGVRYEIRHSVGGFLDLVGANLEETYPNGTSSPKKAVGSSNNGVDLDRAVAMEAVNDETIADLRSALATQPTAWINHDDRRNWISVGAALKSLGEIGREDEARELWMTWGRASPKFDDGNEDPQSVWDGLKADRTDYRAIFAAAQRGGWQNPRSAESEPLTTEDFYAFMPQHQYIFRPTRELWPASSVDARLPRMRANDSDVRASYWLDKNRHVEQMIWAPGEPEIIGGRLVVSGGWKEHSGSTCFNQYQPPRRISGDASKATRWLEHLRRIYPDNADHIVKWLAHRVQRPGEKINHALVLGGSQGIGKDTLLVPVKDAIGPWNFVDITPAPLLGRFNPFIKSVILRISEARDLGDVNRYAFYDHLKTYTAAPPDVLYCDEKHVREHAVFNVCGVIITTNHKSDGIYLPPDDRRHYVAWSNLSKEDFDANYWRELYAWYAAEGAGHVAAYLASLDLTEFDPKEPPPPTAAFWDIVNANRAPEDAELADVLELLQNPPAVTLKTLSAWADYPLNGWLLDEKIRRQIPHRLESAGYVQIRNPSAKSGLWTLGGKHQAIYARKELAVRDQLAAAQQLCSTGTPAPTLDVERH